MNSSFKRANVTAAVRDPSLIVAWRAHGAWNFPFDPDQCSDVAPALWRADENPGVIVIPQAGAQAAGIAHALASRAQIASCANAAGRHLVLADSWGRYRLTLFGSTCGDHGGYCVAGDTLLAVRLAALAGFHLAPQCRQAIAARKMLKPTAYQRQRLAKLLAILDKLQESELAPATVRDIARDVVFPGLRTGRAIDWKSSSHRRQAQRLIAEARRMAITGYRTLLRGACPRGGPIA